MSQSPHIVKSSHPIRDLLRDVIEEPDPDWDGQYGREEDELGCTALDEGSPTELGPPPALSQGTQVGHRLPFGVTAC